MAEAVPQPAGRRSGNGGQTELSATFPEHVVCSWIGNSADVAREHYLRVTDADFERAAGLAKPQPNSAGPDAPRVSGGDVKSDARVTQKPTSHRPALSGTEMRFRGETLRPQNFVPLGAGTGHSLPVGEIPDQDSNLD